MRIELILFAFIAMAGVANILRLFVTLIASDIYDLKLIYKSRRQRARQKPYKPKVSILIPAYNEEVSVLRAIESIRKNDYLNKEIIIVNDGSSDSTLKILKKYQVKNPGTIRVINQQNMGKGMALNRGIIKWSKGEIIMVLDADSLLAPNAIEKMVKHFRDPKVIAASCNIKIIPSNKIIAIAQQLEHRLAFRMKRMINVFNTDYIICGVGSTFRRSSFIRVGGFDHDTWVEDMDLTFKFIQAFGNKRYKIHFAADSIAYTEPVSTLKSLLRQRYRWKYGFFQTLIKNRSLFFSTSNDIHKRLTWLRLPFTLAAEMYTLLEPIAIIYLFLAINTKVDPGSFLVGYIVVTIYFLMIIFAENTNALKNNLKLALLMPFLYLLIYFITIVYFVSLVQTLIKFNKLYKKEGHRSSWDHVERSGVPVAI